MQDLMSMEEVADYLRTSIRNVKALKAARKLTGVSIPRNGLPPVHMYHRSEVESLQAKRIERATAVLPEGAAVQFPASPSNQLAVVRSPQSLAVQSLPAADSSARQASPVVPVWRKRFLTLREASQYSGFGKGFIASHVNGYPVGPRGSTVYRRSDLDALEPES